MEDQGAMLILQNIGQTESCPGILPLALGFTGMADYFKTEKTPENSDNCDST